jgi:hypothetical protein
LCVYENVCERASVWDVYMIVSVWVCIWVLQMCKHMHELGMKPKASRMLSMPLPWSYTSNLVPIIFNN